MKRIVNGVTYNTDTSARLAVSEWEDDDGNCVGTLYQTRGGAFFVDKEITANVWNEREQEKEVQIKHIFLPLSRDDVHEWLMTGEVEVFSNPFEDPPEAEAEREAGATIYIRVPASLKHRVDDAAKEAKASANAWAMRCVERCLNGFPQEIAEIFQIAAGLSRVWGEEEIGKDLKLDEYKLRTATEALEEIAQCVERFAQDQFGTDDLVNIEGGQLDEFRFNELVRQFSPYPDERDLRHE